MGLQQAGERLKALGDAFKDPIRSLGAIGSYLAGRAKRQVTRHEFTKVDPGVRAGGGDRLEARPRLQPCRRNARPEIRQEHHRETVSPGTHGERGDRPLPRLRRAFARHVGDRAPRRRRCGAGHVDCVRVFVPMAARRARRNIRGLRRHQDARLKAIAERSLESGELGPEPPTDE
jgi:hypothetical protein